MVCTKYICRFESAMVLNFCVCFFSILNICMLNIYPYYIICGKTHSCVLFFPVWQNEKNTFNKITSPESSWVIYSNPTVDTDSINRDYHSWSSYQKTELQLILLSNRTLWNWNSALFQLSIHAPRTLGLCKCNLCADQCQRHPPLILWKLASFLVIMVFRELIDC